MGPVRDYLERAAAAVRLLCRKYGVTLDDPTRDKIAEDAVLALLALRPQPADPESYLKRTVRNLFFSRYARN